ncbi:DUF3631 domain-containing protein [Bradyrhizobium sp. McL0616]|uniref:DUF3631 domain-containing protein n=1 Tax=Bradyrhizobium sp. McL0616 TaxID=3415674 RepID=UPI003CF662AF
MTPTDVRQHMIKSGYVPTPVEGKAAVLEGWPERVGVSQDDLAIWSRLYPCATNTGMLCAHCPTLDIDILDEAAVDDAVALVRERFGERGKVLLRYGRRPKVAIPFRTDMPFAKVHVLLTAPDGDTNQKVEFLCRGQQVVVHGVHPDTQEMYQWSGGNPGNTKRAELPLIDEAEAQALMDDLAAVMLHHGYQRSRNDNANGKQSDAPAGGESTDGSDASGNWGDLYANILAGHALHDSLRDLAAKLVKAGTDPGAVVNTLRSLMARSEAPHDKRWKERHREIPELVKSGLRLLRENRQREEDVAIDAVAEHDGAPLLDDVRTYLDRFVCYPSEHATIAHTLWIAHTHLMSAWESTPRLAFLSAEPESGKTRCLEVTEPLVPRPINTMNSSASYLFRKTGSDEGQPTVLFDEIDTIFGPRAKEHEDIRAFINSGHRRGAKFGRCVVRGTIVETEEIESYAAVALAGIGWLPDTILTRSIIIRMRRRLRGERVEPFRHRLHTPEGAALCRRLIGWARMVAADAEEARPVMPPSVEDRQADGWEPLLAVADLAGGAWPTLAREAAEALVAVSRDTPVSLNLRLLGDLRTVFLNNLVAVSQATPHGLPTKRILEELYGLEDAPWHTVNKGQAYTPSQLAVTLRDYEVRSENLRPHPNVRTQAKGYPIAALADAWRRYLPPLSLPPDAVPNVTTATKDVYERFFEVVVTPVTVVTPSSQREGGTSPPSELDPSRINQLAGWYCKRAKALQAEMSPAILKAHLEQQLRETLGNEVLENALDTEVGRVVWAANKSRSSTRNKS